MLGLSMEELQDISRQLEFASYWHDKWSADLARTIICRLPYDQRDVAEDSHHQCRFGQWYYGNELKIIHDHPSFVAIEKEHTHMHKLARQLLIATTQDGPGSLIEYDNFRNSLDQMHLEIITLKRELDESLHNRDALTGAENRNGLLTTLRELRELVKRSVYECAVIIMDVDHFKTINDNFGHVVGDQVLVWLVRNLKLHMRPYDRVYRYGGDEFLISMPNTNFQNAETLVERMLTGIAASAPATTEQKKVFITVSFGVAQLDSDISVEESINRADEALYVAKRSGRNRACVWSPTMALKD
jgi:diguanylate cyclase